MSNFNHEKIGLGAAVMVALNAMIGVGVVSMPGVLACSAGPASIISFLLSIIFVLCIGLSLGRAAELFPGSGWNYRYPAQWAGHKIGLCASWAYLGGVVVAMGFLVQQVGLWTHKFLPIRFGEMAILSPRIIGIAILVFLTLLVLAGAQISSWGQYVIATCVIMPLIFTSIVCWLNFNSALLTPIMPRGLSSVFNALPQALFGFFGFESIASLYSIVESPSKNVPRAFIAAIAIVGSVYLLFVCGILFSIPSNYFSLGLHETLATVLIRVFPSHTWLATGVLIGATFGIIGTLHSMIWSISTLFRDLVTLIKGEVLQEVSHSDSFNSIISILVTSSLMLSISLFVKTEWLIPLTSVFIVPSYLLSIISLLFIEQEWRSGRNIVTIGGLIGGILLLYYALQATFLHLY